MEKTTKETAEHEKEYFHISKVMVKLFITLIVFGLLVFTILYYTVFTQEISTIEKVIVTDDTYLNNYDNNKEIICENGVSVNRLLFYTKIFSCLRLENGACTGTGKVCLIKSTERKWK
jgi:hypothetical protein